MQLERLLSDKVRCLPDKIPFLSPEAIERKLGEKFLWRVGANESKFGPSPRAMKAMQNEIDNVYLYGDPDCLELRKLLANSVSLNSKNIAIGSGIDDLLGLFVRLFINTGETVVTSLGAYPTFNFHVEGYGAHLYKVPYCDDREDLVGLSHAIQSKNAKMVYLANPDNPMGTWHESDKLRWFISNIPSSCILLLDEAYVEYAPKTAFLDPNKTPKNVIHLRTFSKAYGMAGARIGYAICDETICLSLDKIRNHFGVNRIAQAGAIGALSDHSFLKWVTKEVEAGKKIYEQLALELNLSVIPSATNFIAMDMGSSKYANEFASKLEKNRVFVRMPNVFPLDRCIRITVGPKDECFQVSRAIKDVWTELKK